MAHGQPAILLVDHGVSQVGQLGDVDLPLQKPSEQCFGVTDPETRFFGHDLTADPTGIVVGHDCGGDEKSVERYEGRHRYRPAET